MAGESTVSDIFLSHTGQDSKAADFAGFLADKLQEKHGLTAFLDSQNLKTGDTWKQVIETNAKNCRIFVCIISPQYFQRYWCMHELDLALGNRRQIVPVYLDGQVPKGSPSTHKHFVQLHASKNHHEDVATYNPSNEVADRWCQNLVKLDSIHGIRNYSTHKHGLSAFCAQVAQTISDNTDMLNAVHPVAPSLALEKTLVNKFHHPLVDVFCIHTGAQKNGCHTMVDILSKGGFECFFDREMSTIEPTAQMAMALETCRHAVVVLSKAFLQKKDPCSELCYVFKRMQWLRHQYKGWESVRVVLYDLTVEDYNEEQKSSLRSNLVPPLPDLGPDVVTAKFEAGMRWDDFCHQLKGDLIEHDNDCAVKLWSKFLEEWDADKFPRALNIYKEPPGMKRPPAQDPLSPHPREPKALKF